MSDDTPDATDDDTAGGDPPADRTFDRELAAARALLDDADDLAAFHVGVVRGDRVDTTTARRSEGEQAGLETLSLLASHLRTVADEAGVDAETVAADAASLANAVEEFPTDPDTARDDDGE
ncbi:hypothetical protein ACFQFH_10720 [Halobaculum halobium]|uniref:DUF8113 domain-containing protein n=1 Tax=Halobaculum halobium TaxID=3032281 RepID=A0ABD5TAR6_9EURY|nr:hypothetical protein [Halobaculum sp. SYNS20]